MEPSEARLGASRHICSLFSPPHFLTGLTHSNPLYACRPGVSFLPTVLNEIQVWILQDGPVRRPLRGRFRVRGHARANRCSCFETLPNLKMSLRRRRCTEAVSFLQCSHLCTLGCKSALGAAVKPIEKSRWHGGDDEPQAQTVR